MVLEMEYHTTYNGTIIMNGATGTNNFTKKWILSRYK